MKREVIKHRKRKTEKMASSDLYSPDLSVVSEGGENTTEDEGGGGGGGPTAGSPPDANCSMPVPDWKEEYTVATATVCGMYLVFGLMCAFFGYRWGFVRVHHFYAMQEMNVEIFYFLSVSQAEEEGVCMS